MEVVGYARVSSEDQARDGVSLGSQAEKVRLYASLHGLDLVEVISDPGASAKTLDRPGLSRALGLLDSGEVGGLIVYKLDRLTRSLGDWTSLIDRYFGEKAGRSLMSVSESIDTRTAGGRMMLNILMTVAQWERETIVERTLVAIRFKQSKGERVSRYVPYGFTLNPDGKTLDPNPAEVETLARIRRWGAEKRTLQWIAAELNRLGVPTKAGRPWNHGTIATLLRRLSPSEPSS